MTSEMAAVKNAFNKIASGDYAVARTAARIVAKGAFLAMMALMIVSYAASVNQSAAPAPEPLPPYIYS
jgi:hypothetical protein